MDVGKLKLVYGDAHDKTPVMSGAAPPHKKGTGGPQGRRSGGQRPTRWQEGPNPPTPVSLGRTTPGVWEQPVAIIRVVTSGQPSAAGGRISPSPSPVVSPGGSHWGSLTGCSWHKQMPSAGPGLSTPARPL